jgi:hypothetical protein
LNGQEGEDIRGTEYYNEGNSNNKIKHHPIMSKIANFIVAVEKKCNTVKVMSSKKKMVLDSKVCMDSWSINEVNRIPVIRYLPLRVTPIFSNKKRTR